MGSRSDGPPPFGHADRALLAASAVLLGYAIQIKNGFYHPAALACLALAIASAAAAFARAGARFAPRADPSYVTNVLGAGLISSLLMLAVTPPALYVPRPFPSQHPAFLAGLVASAVLIVLTAADARRRSRVWFPLLLAAFGLLGIWLVRASPDPRIDVMTVQRSAVDALIHGDSPYSITFRNIYANARLYAPGAVRDGRVQFGFPYPPLSLLMIVPPELLLKDLRYAQLLALIAAAAAIGYTTRGRAAPLAGALLLFTPRSFFVLEQSWTESLALCWLGAVVLAATRRLNGRGVLLGLLCAVKQQMILSLLFASWFNDRRNRRETARSIGQAILVAGAVTLPFVLWDPAGFWRSAVVLQFREPFRLDSLSVLSLAAHHGWALPSLVQTAAAIGALAAGLAISFRFAPRTPAGAAAAIGFSFLLLFSFSKKAFCNYYFFVIGALCAAVAASDEAPIPGAERPNRRPD